MAHSTNGTSFIHLSVASGRCLPQCQYSGHRVPFRASLASPEVFIPEAMQLMDDRWEAWAAFFHRGFSLRAPGWMMDLFNCSAIPGSPCGEDKGPTANCNDFRALPALVFFSPPLKGRELQRRPEGPLCRDEKQHLVCSPHHTLSLPGPRPAHALISQGHEAHRAEPHGSPASIFLGPCLPNASPL